ncbi:MAG TPA: Arc family DNA-binding protein [Thermoanaerobaculia bacterium]|nr:Arc family DNA-binding protein [Thermoanaerobaculia bacterium]
MAQVIVRQLDEEVKEKLQRRARRHGRSTEEEIREILRNAVRSEGGVRTRLGSRIAARFRRIGLDKEIPELRGQAARPADLEP